MLNKIKIIHLLFSCYLGIMAFYLYTHQYYNVDIEAYMGLLYKTDSPQMDIKDIHNKVFKELKKKRPGMFDANLSKEEIAIGENTYYNILSKNTRAYEEELQLFSVKPFYNFINYLFFKTGFDASTSTFLISIISYILILILVLKFLITILKNHYLAVLFTILLSLFKPLLDSSRHASPDNLSCLLLLLSFYFFVVKKNLYTATIFGMLCVLTRPEYFIFYSFFYIFIFIYKKSLDIKVKELILSFIYILLSFSLIQYFNQISWSILFMNQFTKVQIYPLSNPDVFDFSSYLNFIKSKMLFEFNSSYFLLLLIFIILILSNKFSLKNKDKIIPYFFFSVIYLSVLVRFVIFPSLANRMMIGFYLVIILSLIYIQCSKEDLFKKASQKITNI